VYELCTDKVNEVNADSEFDISDLKSMIPIKEAEKKDMKIDPIK